VRTLLLTLLLCLPATAQAQDEPAETEPADAVEAAVPPPPTALPPEEAARRAQVAHDSYCADVKGGADALAAQATSAVGPVWTEVVRSHEATDVLYLLYWRGLLARCLGHSDRARVSLETFLAADPDAQGLQGMRKDAEIRLRRLMKDTGELEVPQSARTGATVAGVILGVTAGATGALAGWQADFFVVNRSNLINVRHATADADALIAAGDIHLGATIGLGVGCVASLAGSIAGFAGSQRGKKVAALPILIPQRDGASIALGGRW
jgi:hypothetical protein